MGEGIKSGLELLGHFFYLFKISKNEKYQQVEYVNFIKNVKV